MTGRRRVCLDSKNTSELGEALHMLQQKSEGLAVATLIVRTTANDGDFCGSLLGCYRDPL